MGQGALLVPKVLENLDVDNKGRPRLKPGSKAAKVNTQVHQGAKLIGVQKSLTDAQLKHRKRLSAGAAVATSTLSLGALGAKGAGSGLKALATASKAPKALRKVPGIGRVVNKPHLAKIGGKIDSAAVPVSLASGGIGGLSGYNYAAIQRQEAKRRNVAPVSKARKAKVKAFRREYIHYQEKDGSWNNSSAPYDQLSVKRTGTSAIRRRPKYDLTIEQSRGAKSHPKTGVSVASARSMIPRGDKADRAAMSRIASSDEHMVSLNGDRMKVVRKAYNPERNRHNRNQIEAGALFGGAGAAAGGSAFYGHRAAWSGTPRTSRARSVN